MLNEPGVDELTLLKVLQALSDPTRLAVVEQITTGELLCGALRVKVVKSTLAQHLRVLREAGVTHTRLEGTQRWLSLRRTDLNTRFPGLLDAVAPLEVRRQIVRPPAATP